MMVLPVAALLAAASAPAAAVTIPMGTEVKLVTAEPLSSKTSVKGDVVRLKTVEDLAVDSVVLIPAGTEAVGQVIDARAKGAMGMNGKLTLRPLYLQHKGVTIRLTGSRGEKASVEAGAVIGMVVLGVPLFTGRSANLPAGTPVPAWVEKSAVILP